MVFSDWLGYIYLFGEQKNDTRVSFFVFSERDTQRVACLCPGVATRGF